MDSDSKLSDRSKHYKHTTDMELFNTATRVYLGLLTGKPDSRLESFSIPRKPFEGLIVYETIFCGNFFFGSLNSLRSTTSELTNPGRNV